MALVRRIETLAQSPIAKQVESAIAQVVTHAAGVARTPALPRQATPGETTTTATGTLTTATVTSTTTAPDAPPPAHAPGTPASGAPRAGAAATSSDQAAASPTMPASSWAVAVSFAIVAAGAGFAWWLPHGKPIEIGSAVAVYGGLLAFAAAIERLLEPFTHWLPGRNAANNYEESVANMINDPAAPLTDVARAKSDVDRAVADRTVLLWSVATAIATVAAGASGFDLLRMLSTATPSVPIWVDALVTGLIVGSGTKPLHDLITKAQPSKDTTGAAA